jgi:hypothetical protein
MRSSRICNFYRAQNACTQNISGRDTLRDFGINGRKGEGKK